MKNVLTPNELSLVNKVTDEASDRLGCDAAMKAIIGRRVLNFANKGERRYDTLLAIAMDETSR